MTTNNNKGIECKCEEDHNGNCYFCGRNMLSSPLTMDEDWKSEFREYFDKTLKPKKPAMGNLDRELLVDFIEKRISSAVSQALEEAEVRIRNEYENCVQCTGLGEKMVKEALKEEREKYEKLWDETPKYCEKCAEYIQSKGLLLNNKK